MAAQVDEVNGDDVICMVKNSATLAGSMFTLHASQVHIDLPTLTDRDKEVSYSKFMTLIKKNHVYITSADNEVQVTLLKIIFCEDLVF